MDALFDKAHSLSKIEVFGFSLTAAFFSFVDTLLDLPYTRPLRGSPARRVHLYLARWLHCSLSGSTKILQWWRMS